MRTNIGEVRSRDRMAFVYFVRIRYRRCFPSFTRVRAGSDRSNLLGTVKVIAVSPLLLANSGLTVGEIGSISTLATSGIELIDAERICLIYDLKGKAPVKDSFFEAFVKETISEFILSHF